MRCYSVSYPSISDPRITVVSDDKDLFITWMKYQPEPLTPIFKKVTKSEYQSYCDSGMELVIDGFYVYPYRFKPVIDTYWRGYNREIVEEYLTSLHPRSKKVRKAIKTILEFLEDETPKFVVPSLEELESDESMLALHDEKMYLG